MKNQKDKPISAPEALTDDQLGAVAGGYHEESDPAFNSSKCPRGVTAETFPRKPECCCLRSDGYYKCTFLEVDDDGPSFAYVCSRFNYRKE